MTNPTMRWVRSVVDRTPEIAGRVLEVGSRNVNGSVRECFLDRNRFPSYWGVDLVAGPGVDQTAVASHLPFDSGEFDGVVSTEMLEHDSRFWESFQEWGRVLTDAGWLIVTTRAFGFPRHDFPSDYWRFSVDGLREAFTAAGFAVILAEENSDDRGVYGYGRKARG